MGTRFAESACVQQRRRAQLREIDVVKDDSQVNPLGDLQRRDMKELITKGLTAPST